ncbi:MAG TPA: DUF6089 family protein [Bacteroidales bacterium]|nr:DUF6089 family protein [Bacteroidales bacterium]
MKRLIQTILTVLLLILPAGVKGQAYRMELGLLGGVSSYMGDANSSKPIMNERPAFGLLGRYNLSGNLALKANILSGGVAGSTVGDASAYFNGEEIHFNRRLVDAGVQFELGFYQYGVAGYKAGASKVCPYISAGIGLTGYESDKTKLCANIPFGVGVKAKVLPRLNVGCEWSFRKTLADDLDYAIGTSGFLLNNLWAGAGTWNKNKDWYSVLHIYVTFDLYGTGSDCYK